MITYLKWLGRFWHFATVESAGAQFGNKYVWSTLMVVMIPSASFFQNSQLLLNAKPYKWLIRETVYAISGHDNRTRGWFLVDSPLAPLIIMIIYYYLVKKIGPELMKNRKPFNIDKIIQVYNILQVVLCGVLTFESFRYTWGSKGNYNWFCQPIDKSMSPKAIKVAFCIWCYYMMKLLDLFDTVFFVLRKKFNQATFLHVYHHLGTIVLGYMGAKYFPDGHGVLIVPINSFVHCFMYLYYFITNYNPAYKKNMWWKKYITQIQIVQFLILLIHMGVIYFMPECQYPRLPGILLLPQLFLMLVLFSNFYKKTYLTPIQLVKTS